jgi:hypothetical protein
MDTIIPTLATTFLTLELSRAGRPAEGSLSTAAWRLVISEAARCGIQSVRFVDASGPGAEVEELSALASSEGLNVAAYAETGPYGPCGNGHAAVLSDGTLSRCLHSPLVAGNIKDKALGELLTAEQWRLVAGTPCPARGWGE